MERTGEITAVRGEYLEITFCRPADCEKCQACRGGQKQTTLTIRGEGNIGDIAVVEMPTKTVMHASALAYALPLVGLMAGLFLGSALFPSASEGAGALGGVVGLALSAGYVALTERKRRADSRWQPILTEIIPQTADKQSEQSLKEE